MHNKIWMLILVMMTLEKIRSENQFEKDFYFLLSERI